MLRYVFSSSKMCKKAMWSYLRHSKRRQRGDWKRMTSPRPRWLFQCSQSQSLKQGGKSQRVTSKKGVSCCLINLGLTYRSYLHRAVVFGFILGVVLNTKLKLQFHCLIWLANRGCECYFKCIEQNCFIKFLRILLTNRDHLAGITS